MVKQWKKSLEQSDILSDGTAFRGSAIPNTGTIPNTEQVGQGIDWSNKTPNQISDTYTTVLSGVDTNNTNYTTSKTVLSGSGFVVVGDPVGVDVEFQINDGEFIELFEIEVRTLIDDVQISSTQIFEGDDVFDNPSKTYSGPSFVPPTFARFDSSLGVEVYIDFGSPTSPSSDVDVSVQITNDASQKGVLLD